MFEADASFEICTPEGLAVSDAYSGGVIYRVKGSVRVLFVNLHSNWEGKGRECKFQNKAYRNFEPRNNSTPAQ